MKRIGLTGGIGSGKSTAARIFSELGVPVYDSDLRAKEILGSNPEVIEQVKTLLGENAYSQGVPDRKYIAGKVFSDPELLAALNAIIHPAVRKDYRQWAQANSSCAYTIIESAILFESAFDNQVDEIIVVTAPESLRIERTMKRDECTREAVEKRMQAQMSDSERLRKANHILYAVDYNSLREQIFALDKKLRGIAVC